MSETAAARPAPRLRRLACGRCGADFACTLDGPCWCSDEPFRVPVPAVPTIEGSLQDCLCPTCLRALAQTQASAPVR